MIQLSKSARTEWFKRKREAFWRQLAWCMPRQLVLWCLMRAFAHGTQGKHGQTIASELTMFQAVKRWEESN